MWIARVLAVLAVVAAAAVPCLAQSLEVREGALLSIEKVVVDAKVDEGVALVDFDETFRSGSATQQEGVWSFRLPADAVISSFSMWMNGQEKTGRVLEAGTARRVYDSIVAKRKDPGLVEQTGWLDFKVSVFPIPAKDTVRIRLRYAYVLPDDLGLETMEIPLPVKCGPVGDLRIHATVAAARGLATIDCPSHPKATLVSDAVRGTASWSGDGVTPSGPFVLRVLPKRDGFDVAVVAHRASSGDGAGEGFFVARIVPRLAAPPQIPRDVVFVVDRSGSMEGRKMEQARAALLSGLGTLKPEDRFAVVSFSSDVTTHSPDATLLRVTDASLDAARRAARELTASGGTNIAGALDAALALRGSDPSRLFAVVFLTDGTPTVGETKYDTIIANWRIRSAGAARLFAFGVGDDVKDFLLTKLAAEGRGSATYVRLDEDLEVKISALVGSIRTPLLVDPEVSVDGDGVEVLDREPSRLPDVFQGRAVVVAGRFRGAGKATLHVRGRSGGKPVEVAVPMDFAAAAERPHVAQIWAKLRVERLLDDLRTTGANAEIREEILRLGVKHQVVTPYTSFLVVEDGVHVPDPSETARVPDAPGGGGSGGPSTGGGGHTGSYRGPGSSVPPDSREPSDPPPPPDGSGPSTPGGEPGGGPTTGGPDASGPSTPSSGGGGGGGPNTGAGRPRNGNAPFGYEGWTWWWQYGWMDMVPQMRAGSRVAPSAVTIDAMRTLLRDESQGFHVRSEAALSLAAMGDEAIVPDLLRIASSGTDHRQVAERAVLALGLFATKPPAVRAFLLGAVRGRASQGFVRPFAAIALGLRREGGEADAETLRALFAVVDDAKQYDPDLRAACLISIGSIGGADTASRLVPFVSAKSADSDVPFAAHALGRIGSTTVVPAAVVDALIAGLDRRGITSNANRSAALALGRIAPNCLPETQRRIVDALVRALDSGEDTTENWSAISLGRIAGDAATEDPARSRAVLALVRLMDGSKVPLQRAYAALGLGVALRGEPCGLAAKTAADLRARLRAALDRRPDVKTLGAYALAAGLSRDPTSAASLDALVNDRGMSSEVRDHALIGAALLGGDGVRETVRTRLPAESRTGLPCEAAAVAGDPGLVPDLIAVLRDKDSSVWKIHTAAAALGCCGDATAVPELRRALADPALSDLARACAVRALGRVCGDFGPLDRAVEGINYRAYVPAIGELMSLR